VRRRNHRLGIGPTIDSESLIPTPLIMPAELGDRGPVIGLLPFNKVVL